ncbi:hypothetical protein L9F63_003865, partial [Diploptera punctata]
VHVVANELDSLRANHQTMESLVEEINGFHTGAKRQIIKQHVALSVMEQRLRFLQDVFKEPLESHRSLRENLAICNISTRELID